jgi:ATP-binding cassette subfamily C (CFTR/MRP) protein 1
MAIDASRFAEITQHIHILWAGQLRFSLEESIHARSHCLYASKGPLQLIIALVLLYQQMQLSIIPGVVLLLIMIPINLFLQRIQKKLTAKQMTVTDQRIKIMNEILNGIRVLKLYAWEMAFVRSITHIRKQELRYIRQDAIVSALSNLLWTFTPILVR